MEKSKNNVIPFTSYWPFLHVWVLLLGYELRLRMRGIFLKNFMSYTLHRGYLCDADVMLKNEPHKATLQTIFAQHHTF